MREEREMIGSTVSTVSLREKKMVGWGVSKYEIFFFFFNIINEWSGGCLSLKIFPKHAYHQYREAS